MYYPRNYSHELYHYGVKGTKWGKRKARPVGASSDSAARDQ